MICPTCAGSKVVVASHARMADGSSRWGLQLPCFQCGGSGEVPAEMANWIEEGRRMREARIARRTGLREEAARRGISASKLSNMESGREAPVWNEPAAHNAVEEGKCTT